MTAGERDPHSGYLTTGHEWNGITELNTPVPRVVYAFLLVAYLFAVGCWLLLPAWPLGVTYTKGLLGIDQRTTVEAELKQAAVDRQAWLGRFETASFRELLADANAMAIVRRTGSGLFRDNCAACHGVDAKGGKGFPNLTTASWLWGGTPEAIADTIRVGINSAHPDSRVSQMPAFGHDNMLPREDILAVVDYVASLTAKVKPPADRIAAGQKVFAANCVACHGEDAAGKTDVGAPNLTDATWIYGGDTESIYQSVWRGRQGHMPTWEGRLTPAQRKILALYLADRRERGP